MKRPFVGVILSVVAGLCVLAAGARASEEQELAALKERFKQRYAKLLELKQSGQIGETAAGLIAEVKSAQLGDDAKKLLRSENDDRRKLYEVMARQQSVSPAKVAERNAARNFDRAGKGEYLQDADGTWRRK